jgi:peptide chain release factor 2
MGFANDLKSFGGIFEFDKKSVRLLEINKQLEDPQIWNQHEKVQVLGRERAQLEQITKNVQNLEQKLLDAKTLFELTQEEGDESLLQSIASDIALLEKEIIELEFQRLFPGEMDQNSAYMDIQAGSGGTEAQDWANMLLRMYLRFGEHRNFKVELIEASAGEVVGIKSATIKFSGGHAYGWLRTETGVHRLVRKSPFDSSNRRHTSFASVFVYPEVDENIAIEINPADLRIDTYRASGAGGQHVNRTDSAVRITHLPSKTVVQCQADRSQHKNRAQALNQLKAKLYELEMQKRRTEKEALESTKMEIGWGSQIRSYVLDDARVKDLRTGIESGNPESVLDGNLDKFIEASLKEGL